jgi:DNA-binding MarR family transcriptional regulator
LELFDEEESLKSTDATDYAAFPPPYLREAYLRRFPLAAMQRLALVFALKSAHQQITNVLNEWLADTAGSPARFQALALLWAAGDRPVPHQEIIALLHVKRATVSALMYSLEQDGLVESVGDQQDRRRLLARITEKGSEAVTTAMERNAVRLEKVLTGISPEELALFQSLLGRIKDGFLQQAADEKANT